MAIVADVLNLRDNNYVVYVDGYMEIENGALDLFIEDIWFCIFSRGGLKTTRPHCEIARDSYMCKMTDCELYNSIIGMTNFLKVGEWPFIVFSKFLQLFLFSKKY